MMNRRSLSLILSISLFIYGCGPRSLRSGAENVQIYSYHAHKSCRFLGDIINPSVHKNLNLSSSIEDIQKDDMNFLKNEGARLGANVVIISNHHTYQTKIKRYGRQIILKGDLTINEHYIEAKAYICPN